MPSSHSAHPPTGPDGGSPAAPTDALPAAPTDALPVDQLTLIVRDLAHRARADAVSLTVGDSQGRAVRISADRADRAELDARSPSANSAFVAWVIKTGCSCAGVLDPSDTGLGLPSSSAVLRYAFGAAVRPPNQPPGALCIGFAVTPPQDRRRVTLWIVERYAGLAALCLHDGGLLEGVLSSARLPGLGSTLS